MIRLIGGPSDGVELPEGLSTATIRVPFVHSQTRERRWARYRHVGSTGDTHEYRYEYHEPHLRAP